MEGTSINNILRRQLLVQNYTLPITELEGPISFRCVYAHVVDKMAKVAMLLKNEKNCSFSAVGNFKKVSSSR